MGTIVFLRPGLTGAVDRATPMTPEIYTIIAVATALAGLALNGQRYTANSIAELRKDLNALSEQVHRDIAELSERLARVETLLQYIVPRPADPPDADL